MFIRIVYDFDCEKRAKWDGIVNKIFRLNYGYIQVEVAFIVIIDIPPMLPLRNISLQIFDQHFDYHGFILPNRNGIWCNILLYYMLRIVFSYF